MIDVAVLGGGVSAEHDVSLRSAAEVCRGLDRSRWRVWPVFIGRSGGWHAPDAPAGGGIVFDASLGDGLPPGVALAGLQRQGVRIVFPALHGRGGEDGTLQGMLDLHGVAYVGSGTAASAVGMDKIRTRECLRAHDVPMAEAVVGVACGEGRDLEAESSRVAREVGFPCFLKIDLSGSSCGVARCDDRAAVLAFLRAERGRRYVAEARLEGEEISVPVLGNSGAAVRALPPIGIYPLRDAWFDVAAKYQPGRTEEVVPPRGIDAATIADVQELAVRCHTALGCDGVSRTDMIVTAAGPRVLEVNTIPGLTEQSLLPKCAAAAGIPFGALLDELLELALARVALQGAAS